MRTVVGHDWNAFTKQLKIDAVPREDYNLFSFCSELTLVLIMN